MTGDAEIEVKDEKAAEQTPAEIAAAEKLAAAEARADAAEAAAAAVAADKAAPRAPKSSYSVSDFTEAEWVEAEGNTGKDRKALLADINLRAGITANTHNEIESMRAQHAVREELQDAFDADPLSPKFKAEAKKFMGDIPGDLLKTAEGSKKWVAKAVAFAKSQIKLPTSGRKVDNMDTKESATIKEKSSAGGFSVEEKEVIESHGRKVEDFAKMQHPIIKDGIIIRSRDEKPTFGAK